MVENPKRFEDWPKVDCNDCQNYWNDTCDGVPQGSERSCNSYKATRSIVIPAKIKRLEERADNLRVGGILTSVCLLLHLLFNLFGG